MIEVLPIVTTGLLTGIVGYFFWRLRVLTTRIENTMTKKETKEFITLKSEKALILNQELKEDVKRLEDKVDTLINIALKSK